jgi:hypothetical protein
MKKAVFIGKTIFIAALIVVGSLFPSCKIKYSLSGVNIDPLIKTISIQHFPNRAPVVQAQLSQLFTDALIDKVQGQTNLELVSLLGDVDFSGEIRNYETRPVAISGNETAALNRLTISVRVKFTNSINPDESYDSQFSRYEDYPSSQNLADVEDELIQLIVEQLIEDIFNKAFVNW